MPNDHIAAIVQFGNSRVGVIKYLAHAAETLGNAGGRIGSVVALRKDVDALHIVGKGLPPYNQSAGV